MKNYFIAILFLLSVVTLFTSCKVNESHRLRYCHDEGNLFEGGKLFATLPDYAPTPDAFAIAPDCSLILSCPNFADTTKQGVLLRLSKNGRDIKKITNTPILQSTKKAHFMGLTFDDKGILYVCDNQGWTGTKIGKNQGRLLRLTLDKNNIVKTEVIASGMSHPNGVRYRNGFLYVTQSMLPKIKSEKLTSGIYKFKTSDRNIKLNNDRSDKNLIFTNETKNIKCQYGLDGLVFNKRGELFVGDFGDGIIFKLSLNKNGDVKKTEIYAVCPITSGIDGMDFDDKGNLYVAGFSRNQILKVMTNGVVTIIAQYNDNDGSGGQIDQGADVIVYGNKLLISNFDCVTDSGKTNRKHDKPYTISYLELF